MTWTMKMFTGWVQHREPRGDEVSTESDSDRVATLHWLAITRTEPGRYRSRY
jgi:hypothetical protein